MADLTLVGGLLTPPPPPSQDRRTVMTKRDTAVAALARLGISEEEIAARLHLKSEAVKKSLNKWANQQWAGSADLVQIRVNEMALGNLELVNQLIRDGLTATKAVTDDEGNELRREPDFATRKQFAVLLKDWAQVVVPKTPLMSQVINQNNQQNNFSATKGQNMEGRLRMIREKNGLKSDEDDDDDIVDAEFDEVEIEGSELEENVELESEEVENDAEDSSQGS